MQQILRQIAAELRVQELDDVHLRELEARLAYLCELEDRRSTVLKSIEQQGKLAVGLRK